MRLKALEILKDRLEICTRIFIGDEYSDSLDSYENECNILQEAIAELEALETKDRLAELEKVILDYYLAKGHRVDIKDWDFRIELISLYKAKRLIIEFVHRNKGDIVFDNETETTKEIFDKAFEHFKIKE
ncbi:hypothetical protein ACNSOP_08985 [Aliarcobacter lanthieri]|uniref:hypothetical protein n=1 Tax=Aliarcobacter lanthieri TaxID=1355374 RepID=UPI003AA7FCA1